jgi:hypothetical protein
LSLGYQLGPLIVLSLLRLLSAGAVFFWQRVARGRVTYTRTLSQLHAFPADTVELVVQIVNRKPLPLIAYRPVGVPRAVFEGMAKEKTMEANQAPRHLVQRACCWGGWMLMLGLAACGVADRGTPNTTHLNASRFATSTSTAQPTAPTTNRTPSNTLPATALPTRAPVSVAAPAPMTDAWQTYRSDKGGYSIEYPAAWAVREQAGAGGTIVTTFTPAGGGVSVIVQMQPKAPAQGEPLQPIDLPNTRCQPVTGNRGIATRCLDTVSRTTATLFKSQGTIYTITSAGKGMDQAVYQHMLESFVPIGGPVAAPQPDLESLFVQSGDLPAGIAGQRAEDPMPTNFDNDPPATTIQGLQFARDGRAAGSVTILRYAVVADGTQAFKRLTTSVHDDAVSAGNTAQRMTNVGEDALTARLSLASSTYGTDYLAVVVFARCHALVDIRMFERPDVTLATVIAYAKRLDQRLSAVVCQ